LTRSHGAGDERGKASADAQIELDLLDELVADYEAEYGPVPDELVEEAMREWPDHEGA
jgi:hypothetical protein